MSFGYPVNTVGYSNPSQVRRAVDMIYQRGATYEVILTGSTFVESMELVVDMYNKDVKVGSLALVPYDVSLSGLTYYYKFGIRPYQYMSNYIESEHYTSYPNTTIGSFNIDVNVSRTQYKNITRANYKYGYRYYSGTTLVTEWTGSTPTNDFYHNWQIPQCTWTDNVEPYWVLPECDITGKYFDYIGGQLQMDEHFILQNYDQEIGQGLSPNPPYHISPVEYLTPDYERNYSPAAQFIFDYPRTPFQSEKSRFLTDAPRIQFITQNEGYNLYYLIGQTGDRKVIEADFVVFKYYGEQNNLIVARNFQLVTSSSSYGAFRAPTGFTDTLDIWSLPCGPTEIDDFGMKPTNVPWSDVAYYTVQICGGYPTDNGLRTSRGPIVPVSEKFYFYLTDNCGPERTRIAWLNNRGGYDYYTFTAYRQDTKKISRQTYDSRYYATNLSSADRDIGRTIKTFATDVEQEIVLETDFISVPVGNWLEQLFYSPQVYIVKNDYISPISFTQLVYKDLTPTQVLSTEVETITKKHQKLNKYRITMKVANNFFVNKGF